MGQTTHRQYACDEPTGCSVVRLQLPDSTPNEIPNGLWFQGCYLVVMDGAGYQQIPSTSSCTGAARPAPPNDFSVPVYTESSTFEMKGPAGRRVNDLSHSTDVAA